MDEQMIADIAKALRTHFNERTGFAPDADSGAVTACYGGHWISLDTNALARASHSVMAGKVAEARAIGIREAAEWVAKNMTNNGVLASVALLEELGVTDKLGELLTAIGERPALQRKGVEPK